MRIVQRKGGRRLIKSNEDVHEVMIFAWKKIASAKRTCFSEVDHHFHAYLPTFLLLLHSFLVGK